MRSALPGALLLAAAVLFQLRGLGAVRGAVRASPGGASAPWWEGYARDGINLAAAALAFAGLAVSGYGGPAGVALAPCVALVAYGGDAACRRAGPRRASSLLLALLAASLAPARPLLGTRLDRLLEQLAPAAAALAPPAAQKSSTLPASIDVCFTDERGSVA